MNPSSPDSNHRPADPSSANHGDDPAAKPAVVLPPRRAAPDRSSAAAADRGGLHIEPNVARGKSTGAALQLEVQEIHSGVVRLDPVAPPPPKVAAQITFQQRPARDPNSPEAIGENARWGEGQRYPIRWMIASGAGIFIIVIAAFMLLPAINASNTPKTGSADKTPNQNPSETSGIEDRLLTMESEARQLFRSYATATITDDVVPLVRDGAALRETLRQHWRPSRIPKSWKPDEQNGDWNISTLAGHPAGVLQGTLPDLSKFTAYFVIDRDQLRLDWKATTAFSTATFAELEKKQGDATEIRGEISPSQFYTAIWPEADYQSYRLLSPNKENLIWCYVRRGTAAHEAIARRFQRSQILGEVYQSLKITLRLQPGPDGAPPNEWLIGELLCLGWVEP